MYFRTARLRFHLLAEQAWDHEVSLLAKDMELLRDAMVRDDLDGVGALVGNSIQDTFTRMQPFLERLDSRPFQPLN